MSSSRASFPPALTAGIATAALLSLLWYASFILNPAHIGHPVAYAMLLVAEGIGALNVLGIWLALIRHPSPPDLPDVSDVREKLLDGKLTPTVAVFITVAGEPLDVVRTTMLAALAIDVAHRTVVLDDGESNELKTEAKKLGVEYLTRPNKDRKKAGNVNYGIAQVKPKYFAILDCDHVPKKEFLSVLLPYLVADPKIAFVQSPQFFGNTHTFVGGGSAESQEVFYRHIQARKNGSNSAFCVGTNVVFRTEAAMEIGGIYEGSKSEDIWTALLLHERGWKSLYVPRVLAVGDTPETVDGYLRQQTRWATGSFEIFFKRNPLLNSNLTFRQQLQYFHTVTYYFCGFSTILFYLMPLLYTYLEWKPIDVQGEANPFAWIIWFLPYYAFGIFTNAYLLGRSPSWRSFVVTMTSFPAHVSAFVNAATDKDVHWSVSGVIKRKRDYVTAVAPHLLLFLLTVGAMPILAIDRDEPLRYVFLVWMAWNASALFAICKRALPSYAAASHSPLPSLAY
jgi:cellulose synthase (UDP-forming)